MILGTSFIDGQTHKSVEDLVAADLQVLRQRHYLANLKPPLAA